MSVDGNSANVRVGVVGAVFSGPLTADIPANATAALASTLVATLLTAKFRQGGYVSTDGVTQSISSSTSKITAWGGEPVRIVQTEHGLTYSWKIIESSLAALQDYYGEDATAEVAAINGAMLPRRARVLVIRDGDRRIIIVLPDSQITERGDIQYYAEDAVGYEVTAECFADADGNKAYIYMGEVLTAAVV